MVSLFYAYYCDQRDDRVVLLCGLAGLVLYATGSFLLVLLLSMAFSLVGVGVILRLESTARMLIPHWEEALPALVVE